MPFVISVALVMLGLMCATSMGSLSPDLRSKFEASPLTRTSASSAGNQPGNVKRQANATNPVVPNKGTGNVFDVVVKDKQGNYVDNLTALDLSIRIDGKEQAISGFYSPRSPKDADVGSGKILTVILLDALDTTAKSPSYFSDHLRQALPAIPDDGSFAVFLLDATELHTILDFGSTKQDLRNAIDQGRFVVEQSRRAVPGISDPCASLRERYPHVSRAMGSLGANLARFPGHKNVIWFTREMPVVNSSGFYDVLRLVERTGPKGDSSALDRVSFYPVLTDGLASNWSHVLAAKGCSVPVGGGDDSDPFERSVGTTRIASVEDVKEDSLYKLAEATGGHFFSASHDLRIALSLAVEDSKHLYSLTILAGPSQKKDSYHTVVVNTKQGNWSVGYHQGYFSK